MKHVKDPSKNVSRKDHINGKLTGMFFISATVTAIIGMILYDPILKSSDWLIPGALNGSQIVLGAIFELILVISAIGTAIMLFPYLRKFDGRFALAHFTFRSMEAILILIGIISMLAVVSLNKSASGGEVSNLELLRTVGTALIAIHDWTFILGPCIMLGINTFIYSYVFYRTKLVPRKLSTLGIVGAILILISGFLALFNILPLFTTGAILLALPVAIYEMILAGLLIAKGFATNDGIRSATQKTENILADKLHLAKPILTVILVVFTALTTFSQDSHLAIVVATTDANFNYGNKNNDQIESLKEVYAHYGHI